MIDPTHGCLVVWGRPGPSFVLLLDRCIQVYETTCQPPEVQAASGKGQTDGSLRRRESCAFHPTPREELSLCRSRYSLPVGLFRVTQEGAGGGEEGEGKLTSHNTVSALANKCTNSNPTSSPPSGGSGLNSVPSTGFHT